MVKLIQHEENHDARLLGRRAPVLRRHPTATELEAQLAEHAKVLACEGVWHRAHAAPGWDLGSWCTRWSAPLPGGSAQGLHAAPRRVSASAGRRVRGLRSLCRRHGRPVESCRRSVISSRRFASWSFAMAVWSTL